MATLPDWSGLAADYEIQLGRWQDLSEFANEELNERFKAACEKCVQRKQEFEKEQSEKEAARKLLDERLTKRRDLVQQVLASAENLQENSIEILADFKGHWEAVGTVEDDEEKDAEEEDVADHRHGADHRADEGTHPRKYGERSKRSQDANDAERRDVRSHARDERHETHHHHHEVHDVPSVLQVRFLLEVHPRGDHLDEHLNREDDGEEELAVLDGGVPRTVRRRRGRSRAPAAFHLGGLHLTEHDRVGQDGEQDEGFEPLRLGDGDARAAKRVLASECPEARRRGVVAPGFIAR